MTYRQLAEKLLELDDAQLNQLVTLAFAEENPIRPRHPVFRELLELTEDQINPSGDGWEPKSLYADLPEYADEPIVAGAGEVYIVIGAEL